MHLCIDIGNTFVKYGLFSGNDLLKFGKENAYTIKLIKDLLDQNSEIEAIIISSVRNSSELNIKDFEEVFTLILEDSTPLPIQNDYNTKETLGKDRIALAVAACSEHPNKNVLVVDIGTCMTIDLVTSERVYKGGIISPGVQMRLDAMHRGTARLPQITLDHFENISMLGSSTELCMMSGALNGLKLELEGVIAAFEKQYKDLIVMITGGDYKHFENQLKNAIFAEPNLVMIGLNKILEYNAQ